MTRRAKFVNNDGHRKLTAISGESVPLEISTTTRTFHVIAAGGFLDDDAAAGTRHRFLGVHQLAELRLS